MWRQRAASVVLLAGLLVGCHDNGSGREAKSPATQPGGAAGATTTTAPGRPTGLLSAWFTGERDAWGLTLEPCAAPGSDQARPSAGPAQCPVAWKTADGGDSWARSAGLDVSGDAASGSDFVTRVHVADAQRGWAYYRSLFATFNGGKRWQRIDLGNPVVALESVGAQAYALVGACAYGAGNCDAPMRVFEGTISTGRWRFVSLGFDLPKTDTGSLIVSGTTVYALISGYTGDQVFLARTTAGRWERRTPPCVRAVVAPIEGQGGLVAACRPPGTNGPVELQTSSDGGRSWALVWQFSFPSPLSSLAVTADAAVVTLDNGDVLRTIDNGMSFTAVLRTGESPGLRFSDPKHGLLTAGPPANRQLFTTRDGGATWQAVKPPK